MRRTSWRFPNGVQALDDKDRDVRASVVEGLLDLNLMRIDGADTSTLPDGQRDARVRNVRQYFGAIGLGSMLHPATPLQATSPGAADATQAGLTINISVQCPDWHDGSGYRYGSGRARPACH